MDKSLDEIISSTGIKKERRVRKSGNKAKPAGGNKAKSTKAKAPNTKLAAVAAKAPEALLQPEAFKIIISGFPPDVSSEQVKDYFQHSVGPVSSVHGSYNEKGKSTGIFTVIFKKSKDATYSYEKFNGVSIDNGRKLKVELVVDPSKKPLAARIKVAEAKPKEAAKPKAVKAKSKAKATAKKPAKPKRAKKTTEELDAEMADYFK